VTDVRTSPKKARKPQQHTLVLWQAIAAVAAEYERMSVRQLFYQLVSRGAIEKTEAAYKRVCDASVQMRLDGSLAYGKITDGHRSRRLTYQHGGLREAIENAHELYRRNFWIDQPVHVEVWCEKDALTGIIAPVCERYGVPYVATRGFPSVTLRYESAHAIRQTGKEAIVFYFGDHDASGQMISANLQDELRHHGAEVTVKRVALNPHQVRGYRLPTRPGKWSDSRQAKFAEQFGDASVELDALPPDRLIQMVESSIVSCIDVVAWERVGEIERLERKTFASLAAIGWEPGTVYNLGEEQMG
jgi:hypothetical protein